MDVYTFAKAFHLIAMIAWFAGLFYLPRLYVYHVQALEKGQKETSELFKIMEYKLYNYIMNPAMMSTWTGGLIMIYMNPSWFDAGWIHTKLTLVTALTFYHISLKGYLRKFSADLNQKSEKFFRLYNEVPTFLMIGIVFLAVFRWF